MSDMLTLSAQTRERAGKGASRAHRREGRVPAVIYGNKQAPVAIHLEEKALVKAMSTGHFMNTVVMIDGVGGSIRTLPKDVQFHPVNDRPLHVDFLRIAEHARVTVAVPVVFTGEEASPGLQRGGVLNIVHHELEVSCDAAEIPSQIEISLDGLEVGDTVHLSSVALPRGVESTSVEDDMTIATLVAPSALKAQGEEDAAEDEAIADAAAAESAEAAAAGSSETDAGSGEESKEG